MTLVDSLWNVKVFADCPRNRQALRLSDGGDHYRVKHCGQAGSVHKGWHFLHIRSASDAAGTATRRPWSPTLLVVIEGFMFAR